MDTSTPADMKQTVAPEGVSPKEMKKSEEEEPSSSTWQQPMKGIAVNTIVLSARDEQHTAKMGKIVCCNYLIWFLNSADTDDVLAEERMITEDVPFEVQTNKLFTIGEGDTTMALELALRHSQQGDLLFLRAASKFAYSVTGRPGTATNIPTVTHVSSLTSRTFNHDEAFAKLDAYLPTNKGGVTAPLVAIPANTDLEFLVQVVGVYDNPVIALRLAMPDYDTRCVEKEKEWGLKNNAITTVTENQTTVGDEEGDGGVINNPAERVVAEMNIRKIAGNGWFANGDFIRASKCYAKAIQMADVYLSEEKKMDEEEQAAGIDNSSNSSSAEYLEEITSLLIAALNNLAACHMSKGDHFKAKEVCVRVSGGPNPTPLPGVLPYTSHTIIHTLLLYCIPSSSTNHRRSWKWMQQIRRHCCGRLVRPLLSMNMRYFLYSCD